jgi:hypothetical protein
MRGEKVPYGGWRDCRRISDGTVELVVTAEVGPRIIRFGFIGEENEFHERTAHMGKTGGEKWRLYGGHRLWHAPEADPRTVAPDNSPLEIAETDGWLCVLPAREESTGIRTEMRIRLLPGRGGEGGAEIVHVLHNEGLWSVELSPWAISVMAPGGAAIVPLPPRGTHSDNLLPNGTIATWAYTDMADPRWSWLEKYVFLRQEPGPVREQKAGFRVPDGWTAYIRGGHLFIKRFHFDPTAHYPDFGSNVECYTDSRILELETLGPLVSLAPGASVEYRENWLLAKGIPTLGDGGEVERHILPRL